MQKQIKINKPIFAEDTEIGPGAVVLLDKATRPIIKLLKIYYEIDPESISGDIGFLYSSDCTGLNDEENYWPGT